MAGQGKKLNKFYKSDLGRELHEKASEIISSLITTQNARILLVGYVDAYSSLFKEHNVYLLRDIKEHKIVRFDKIFIFHYFLEQNRKNLQHLFSRLEKFLVEGGEVVVLASKAYSIMENKVIINCKNIFLESKIVAAMKKSGFVKIKKFLILPKYLGCLSIPFCARFVILCGRIDDRCKISIRKFEPAS